MDSPEAAVLDPGGQPDEEPDLSSYDLIVANISGGKDSQVMLDVLMQRGREQVVENMREKVVAIHADLGRVEWAGTQEIAEYHASEYGVRFMAVARPQGDLLEHIEARGMFPSASARYCTSDHKRGQVAKAITQLVSEKRDAGALGEPARQARVLSVMGIRAEESPARAKKPALETDTHTTSGRRHVQIWLPILDWTQRQVWDRIKQSGVDPHPTYSAGLPRISCCFCVLASRRALTLAARHNPELAEEYRRVEQKIGHTIKPGLSMDRVIEDSLAPMSPVHEQLDLFA